MLYKFWKVPDPLPAVTLVAVRAPVEILPAEKLLITDRVLFIETLLETLRSVAVNVVNDPNVGVIVPIGVF